MRKIIIILIFPFTSLYAQVTCHDDFSLKDTIMFFGNDTIPYTGAYTEYYPGEIKIKGHFTDGLKDGEFIYYDRCPQVTAIENYFRGLKDGTSKYYKHRLDKKVLVKKEIFTKGRLDTGIYWSYTGQLEKIIVNTDVPRIDSFEIDSSIFEIIPYLDIERNGIIKKSDFFSQDSIKVSVAKVICEGCYWEDYNIIDTIVIHDFKIKSFGITNLCLGSDREYICKKGYITKSAIQYIEKCGADKFYFNDILIEDNNGVEYELFSSPYRIINE